MPVIGFVGTGNMGGALARAASADKQNSLLLAYHSHLARNGALRGTATALKLC